MPVQFSYMQQNPDGSVSTQGVTADRPPTWGELHDHVASTGATLLPATPAEQPPPAAREAAAPPPAPAAAAPPPASSVPTTGGIPPREYNPPREFMQADYDPPRSLGTYVLPATGAAIGAMGLPAIATAVAGPIGLFGGAGLASTGAGLGAGAGEYGQAQLERAIYGEPPPGAPTPWERAQQMADVAAKTEMAVQVASPLVTPIARAVLKPFGSTAVSTAAEARPLLRTGALGGEKAAVETGQNVVHDLAHGVEAGHATESMRVGATAPNVTVNTNHLPPLVTSTRNALEGVGATPEELVLFDRNMTPLSQGGPQPLQSVLGAERNLNRWTAVVSSRNAVPELDVLANTTRDAIKTGVEGTPAARPFQNYLDMQAASAPTRIALHEAAERGGDAFQPFLAGTDGTLALKHVVEQGTPEQVAQVGQAWLTSTRQAARTALDPAQYVADAYNALPVPWRSAMFGEQTPSLAKLIGTASGPAPPGLRLPVVGTAQVARPWARGVLLNPNAALATSAVSPLGRGAARTGLYTAVAQGEEPKPPSAGR